MGNKIIKNIVHITTVHSWRDPRIFDKECRSLANQNFEVSLITPDGINEMVEKVSVLRMSGFYKNRFLRVSIGSYNIVKQALALNPDVIHFHDPEIIPYALLFKKKKVKFIYDIHEDYVTDIKQKKYVPFFLRNTLAFLTRFFEHKAHKNFTTIIAEKYYKEMFPSSVEILNYPVLGWAEEIEESSEPPTKLLYTGNITEDRGAIIHSDILKSLSCSELSQIMMIGRCEKKLAQKIQKRLGENDFSRMNIIGVDDYIDFERIIDEYKKRDWIAGLAIFPKTPHYAKKHLTKFFEYMVAGFPIIYSNYTDWENLLGPLNVGISVDPSSPEAITSAVKKLKDNDELREQMSINARVAVNKFFSWEEEQQKLIDLYESL